MDQGFSNKLDWFTMTWALIVWTAHFALLWAASVIFPGEPAARWLALVLTIAAAIALIWLWFRADRPGIFTVPGFGLALSGLGVAYGAVPAAIG